MVFVCYGFLDCEQLIAELSFVFDVHRINVALTRAQRKLILVSGHTLQLQCTFYSLYRLSSQFIGAHAVCCCAAGG